MTVPCRTTVTVAGLVAVLGASSQARAERTTCPLAETGAIEVDGMLDDWKGVEPVRTGGVDLDASFDLRCQYDGQRLQLAIDVRDDLLVRNAAARGKLQNGEDRLVMEVSAGGAVTSVVVFPGYMKSPPRRTVGGAPAPRWLAAEDTLQRRGWSVELDVPLARVAGWSAASPSLSARVVYHDSDRFAAGQAEASPELAVDLDLGDKKDLLQGFLAATKLPRKALTLDTMADVDRARPGRERVVAGGAYVGVIAEAFAYVQLPVSGAADVGKVELVDLRGDGSRVILADVRQSGGGGVRRLLLGYGVQRGALEPLLAVEIGKQQGGRALSSQWRIVRGARGRPELVVEAQPAVGWDEDSYAEAPAPDAEPIHVPWDEDRWGAVYWLEGERVASRVLKGKRRR